MASHIPWHPAASFSAPCVRKGLSMNVSYIATDSYTSLLGISLFSLLENNKEMQELNIYILSPDLSEKSHAMLSDLAVTYHRTVTVCDIRDFTHRFDFSFDTTGFSNVVLARLFMTHYLPDTVDSVLYLDCDVIVNQSLRDLEQIDLAGYAFAAVPELCMPTAQKAQIGLSAEDQYYNAGILYINLSFWREHRLEQSFLDYYASMNGHLLYSDQDILNHCCKGQILSLSHRYNLAPVLRYFPRYFIRTYQPAYYCRSAKEYREILQNPVMIHYLGDERPWFKGNFNPYRKLYDHYKKLSPWKDEPLISGRELYLFCYHILNCITLICPWFRKYFTRWIGIRCYTVMKKK